MAIKVKRVMIKNFKLFQDFSVDFEESNLVVFDGPNGFGKTSFFDAIELLFTGRLRRYSELESMVVDGRQPLSVNPLLNDEGGSGDLVIKAEIQTETQTICLLRKCDRAELQKTCKIGDFKPSLYTLPDFESDIPELVDNEENYLNNLLGKDYLRNFEFLNYIEQEESTYLLKKKDKDRKEAIGHLFNTLEFETLIEKLEEASKKIRGFCDSRATDTLRAEQEKLSKLQSQLTAEPEAVPYVRLISWKKISWDAEELEFPEEQYAQWLGKEGELAHLDSFLANIDEFKKEQQNRKLEALLKDAELVSLLLQCWNFIDKSEEFEKQLSVRNAVERLLQVYEKGILAAIVNGEAILSKEIQDIVQSAVDSKNYVDSVTAIERLHKNATTLSKLLSGVRDSRDAFVAKYMEYQQEVGMKESCPLCGYTWKDAEELKEQLSIQANQLDQLTKDAGVELALGLSVFQRQVIEPIRELLQHYLTTNPLDEGFVAKLIKAKQRSNELLRLNQQLVEAGVELIPLLNKKPSTLDPIMSETLRKNINEKMQPVDTKRLQPYFANLFVNIFNEKFELVTGLDMTAISNKQKYIQWKYSLHQSRAFIEKKAICEKLEEQFNNAKKLRSKIDNLKKIYADSLKTYQRSVIEDIEIIFHIYSGRIVQDYQCGLGLFIAERDGIRFLENPSKENDAIFSMSSGQLAVLVISFTLALNKKYSRTKLLLIDDPIQTLDELNIAGLVELLRNEFQDRQIFISTHEDMMSAYIRYKFEKYGLETHHLNFKEKMLAIG